MAAGCLQESCIHERCLTPEDSAAAIGNSIPLRSTPFPIAEPYSKFSVFFDYTFLDNSKLLVKKKRKIKLQPQQQIQELTILVQMIQPMKNLIGILVAVLQVLGTPKMDTKIVHQSVIIQSYQTLFLKSYMIDTLIQVWNQEEQAIVKPNLLVKHKN